MQKRYCLVSIAAVIAALAVGGSAFAASDCLQLELSQPAAVCAGQLASISATISNSCPHRERVTATFTFDEQALPLKANFGVAGDATVSRQISIPVPATGMSGSHTLTIDLTDASGGQASATLDINVTACAAR